MKSQYYDTNDGRKLLFGLIDRMIDLILNELFEFLISVIHPLPVTEDP